MLPAKKHRSGRWTNIALIVILLVILGLSAFNRLDANEAPEQESQVKVINISQTLMAVSLESGVTVEDAVQAMLSTAAQTNMKLVGRKQVSKEMQKRGIKARHLEVLQFCGPEEAVKAVEISLVYAAYIPCQISVVEDPEGKIWLITRNMDMMINDRMISPQLAEIAIRVNQDMLKIMTAGVTGEF